MEEKELVEKLRRPETCREAFGEMIRLYTEPLYRQVRRIVQSHDDADDVLQNVFMKAWQNIENFRGEARLGTWLHKIAINESMTFLERERKHAGISLDDEESFIVNLIEADRNIDGEQLAVLLRKAVATLPEKQRLVFNMRYFDEMKYEDISAILGTSEGALKTSYHLAVKKIEQFFKDRD
ncbi:MAG: RNA polymerase sigma factor [Duncaniella sp.]|nr:RNA polymerase sigma factor [Duncaniella sp.]